MARRPLHDIFNLSGKSPKRVTVPDEMVDVIEHIAKYGKPSPIVQRALDVIRDEHKPPFIGG